MNVNWREWATTEINFWPEIIPLLTGTGKRVSIFAGDVCAFSNGAFMTDTYENITFFATGMGGGANVDHYLVISVNPDMTLGYEIVPLRDADTADTIRKWQPSE
jgi:hypothetical protein